MKQYFMTVLILIVTATIGFTMPSILLEHQDEQRVENIETQAAEEVVLTSQTELTLIEKLQLMQKDTVTYLSMVQGKNYDRASISVQVQQELRKLRDLEILDLESLDFLYNVEDVSFLIDIEDGSRSMLMWTLCVVDDEWVITVTVDDETGKILGISKVEMSVSKSYTDVQTVEMGETDNNQKDLEKIAEKWGEYLGIPLAESYDRQNPTADLEKEWKKASWLYGVYEDESGMTAYIFRKNSGSVIFLAEPS